jgi:hypothetical protein
MAYKIGTTFGGLATLASLGIPDPKSEYIPGAGKVRLASGQDRDLGAPVIRWHFGFLTYADRDTLRTYCTGASGNIYIESRINDNVSTVHDAFKDFLCIMHWPDEEKDAFFRVPFVIEFTHAVVVTS